MKSRFTIQTSTKSHCGECDGYLDLLCKDNPSLHSLMFWICWHCKRVTQVGVGPVERED